MDYLVNRNNTLWNVIETEGYKVEQVPLHLVYSNQQSVPRGKVDQIKALYRKRIVRVAPPSGFVPAENSEITIIFDGNKRATAMMELILYEDYISTDNGLYPADEAYQMDCGIYPGFMPIAIFTPTSIPGHQLHHISRTKIVMDDFIEE